MSYSSTLVVLLALVLISISSCFGFFSKSPQVASNRGEKAEQLENFLSDRGIFDDNNEAEIEYGSLRELVRELVDAPRERKTVDSNDKKLSGCFQVVETFSGAEINSSSGSTANIRSQKPSWTKYSNFLGTMRQQSNRNYQMFREDGHFLNLSEYLGPSFFAVASGTYQWCGPTSPYSFDAYVNEVSVYFNFFGWTKPPALRLPVKGKGTIKGLYIQEYKRLRLIESEEESVALQWRVDVPPEYMALLDALGMDAES